MTKIHHLNCVKIESPMGSAVGHCLVIVEDDKLVLIDAGIGLLESKQPEERLGKELIEATGFVFDEKLTAIKQIEKLGLSPKNVSDIICSHLDPDHIGGLVDFPKAKVHVSKEEYESFKSGNERYLQQQLSHKPDLELYKINDSEWFGLPARKVVLSIQTEVFFIPLFGHTLGHCGIAIKSNNKWTFYAGDAYYLRAELEDKNHPVDQLATIRAENNILRLESLEKVRKIIKKHGDAISYFGYHDPIELNLSDK
ncbi:MBL fold metallo-hydrolase [Winogradskyella jejuensis]|uniref:Glyoxylase, beta-lactamase superfamily II n=1 Tax=Winogradskyella jejuensis TaxID=1089305 RepID=A0A1M5JLH1_9FLAO|nr:MBL fold metallo-hydrolase [Winogradskyella jejuensis]SHG40873.1 Glyoxylase, beta-lactamase superfamily II [Winogradskyella jejuensis]